MGRLLVEVKIGDNNPPGKPGEGIRDGYFTTYIDEDVTGPYVIGEHSLGVFAYLSVNRDMLPFLKLAVKDNEKVGDKFRQRRDKFNLTNLAKTLGDATLVTKWRGKGVKVPIQDAIGKNIANDIEPTGERSLDSVIEDKNAIAGGSYTVGTAGDYATWVSFYADVTTLTSDLTGTQISDIVNTAFINKGMAGSGHTLLMTTDTQPNGDVTAGWVTTQTNGGSMFMQPNIGGGMTLNMSGLHIRGVDAATYMIFFNGSGDYNITNCFFDGANVINELINFNCAGTVTLAQCWVWDGAVNGISLYMSGGLIDHCFVFSNGTVGFNGRNVGATVRSTEIFDNGTDCTGLTNSTFQNSADSDSTMPSSTDNKLGLTTASEVDTTDTNATFGHPLSSSVNVATGGNTTEFLPQDATGVTDWDASDPSIGPIQVIAASGSNIPKMINYFRQRRAA